MNSEQENKKAEAIYQYQRMHEGQMTGMHGTRAGQIAGSGHIPPDITESEVSREISSLRQSLIKLDNAIAELSGRLITAIKQIPVAEQCQPKAPLHDCYSPIGHDIRDATNSVRQQVQRLHDLMVSLAV